MTVNNHLINKLEKFFFIGDIQYSHLLCIFFVKMIVVNDTKI